MSVRASTMWGVQSAEEGHRDHGPVRPPETRVDQVLGDRERARAHHSDRQGL